MSVERSSLIVMCFNYNMVSREPKSLQNYCQSGQNERMIGGNEVNVNITSDVICDSTKTTCFTEAEAVVRNSVSATIAPLNMEIRDQALKDFLGKPYLVSTVAWTTASSPNAVLYSIDNIGSLLASVTPWANKIVGFGLIRATCVFRVEINASPFQSGLLIARNVPNFAILNSGSTPTSTPIFDYDLVSKYQQPHVLIDCRNTAAEMKIPWTSPFPYYDVKTNICDWGKFSLDVVAALGVGPSASTFADIAIYAHWEDVVLAAPTIPQMGRKEKLVSNETRELQSKPVSSALTLLATTTESLSAIPQLSTYMAPLSWVFRFGSTVASAFGYAKPRLNKEPQIIMSQQMRYTTNSDGPDSSIPLSLIHDNCTELTTNHTITDEDEMSWNYLKSIPHYVSNIAWASASAPAGTVLLTRKIKPSSLYTTGTNTVGGATISFSHGGPIYYLANYFAYWRGSFKVTLRFVKTQYHTGRVQVTWTPGTAVGITPTPTNSLYSLRQIVDLREQDLVTFDLPYMVPQAYLHTGSIGGLPQYSGQLDVVVLNDLKAPETCAQSISIIETYVGGDDLEVSTPSGFTYHQGPYVAQSGGVETLIDSGIADSKIMPFSTQASCANVGENFVSLKQILNRLTNVTNTEAVYYGSGATRITINPSYIGTVSLTPTTGTPIVYGQTVNDAFSICAHMYAYYRGSMKLAVRYTPSASTINATLTPVAYANELLVAPDVTNTIVGIANPALQTNVTLTQPFTSTYYPDAHVGLIYVQVPYTNMTPVAFVRRRTNLLSTRPVNSPINSVTITSSGGFATSNLSIQRACGEDFQFSFFIGTPLTIL